MLFALAIAAGGAAGTLARFGISAWMAPAALRFPFATLLINVVGSFLIGWLSGEWSPVKDLTVRAALTIGFCGGFTTFSTFSIETVRMLHVGEARRAASYVVASVVLSLSAAALGVALARASARTPDNTRITNR
jgi:CrcB protein